jgi:hypothetical protein
MVDNTTHRPIHEIADEIRKDWKPVHRFAEPYLKAMHELSSIFDRYGADDAESVILCFLSNASTWRGEVAKKIKAELKLIIRSKNG